MYRIKNGTFPWLATTTWCSHAPPLPLISTVRDQLKLCLVYPRICPSQRWPLLHSPKNLHPEKPPLPNQRHRSALRRLRHDHVPTENSRLQHRLQHLPHLCDPRTAPRQNFLSRSRASPSPNFWFQKEISPLPDFRFLEGRQLHGRQGWRDQGAQGPCGSS
jgi:hypothetical protein